MKAITAEFIKSAVHEKDFPKERIPEIAFVGRSNVGKSSLINAITGVKGLARTSSTPGRTQLINFFRINKKFTFVDLPGYGYAKVSADVRKAWRPMIENYFRVRENLRCVVLIMDIRRAPEEEEEMLLAFLSELNIPAVTVLTKADKLSSNERVKQLRNFEKTLDGRLVPFSAVTGEGKETLWKEIMEHTGH